MRVFQLAVQNMPTGLFILSQVHKTGYQWNGTDISKILGKLFVPKELMILAQRFIVGYLKTTTISFVGTTEFAIFNRPYRTQLWLYLCSQQWNCWAIINCPNGQRTIIPILEQILIFQISAIRLWSIQFPFGKILIVIF